MFIGVFEWLLAAGSGFMLLGVQVNQPLFYLFHIGAIVLGIGAVYLALKPEPYTQRYCPTCQRTTDQFVSNPGKFNQATMKKDLVEWTCETCHKKNTGPYTPRKARAVSEPAGTPSAETARGTSSQQSKPAAEQEAVTPKLEPSMIFCRECRAKIRRDAKFCGVCGAQLDYAVPTKTQVSRPLQDEEEAKKHLGSNTKRVMQKPKVLLPMLLLALVAAYAILPLVISTEDDLVLSLEKVQENPMSAYYILHLQNRGPFPIIISKAVWSIAGFQPTGQGPSTDIPLMPFGEYSYTFKVYDIEQCWTGYGSSNCAGVASGTAFVSLSLTAKLQILLASRTANLSAIA